ncbi:MAG: HEPN domain-containing protein [Sulfurimonas sp.]|nr:HEPN domain-containing protein [Sulfurimonas sp.]
MNETASIEWLTIAYHDFRSAQILYEANHYTDSIGNDLQQAIENC